VDINTLVRRAGTFARLSSNPLIRQAFRLVRLTYRTLGRWVPSLHLGWQASLRQAVWDGDDLVLRGWGFVRGADQGPRPEFEVWLHRRFSWSRIHAAVSPAEDSDVLAALPRAELNYGNRVFEARFDGPTLSALPAGGTWTVRIAVTGGRRRTWGPFRHIYEFGSPAVMQLRPLGADRLVGPTFSERRGVRIVSRRPGVLVRDVAVDGRQISLGLDSATDVGSAVLTGRGQEDVPLEAVPGADGIRLVGTLPAGRIVVDPETGDRHPPSWIGSVGSGRTRAPLTLLDDSAGHRPDAASTLLVRGDSARSLQVVDVPHFVEVDDVERVDADETPYLRLTGTIVGDPEAFALVMAARFIDLPVALDTVQDDGRFVATVPLRVSMWGGAATPPMRGVYDLEGRLGNERFSTFVAQELIDRVRIIESRPDVRLRIELAQRDGLRVRITRPRNELEYGSYQQAILSDKFARGGTPALDAVYFESFFGRNATCNPLAMDREIARRRPDLPRYWSVEDYSVEVPEGATPLVTGSQDWWRVRESARWIVTNEWLRADFVKRGFQVVLQTWHGSMYKKIGLDRAKGRTYQQRARHERRNWDMFLSQNADTTPIIRRAYEFDEGIVESGYPRNDELHDPDPSRVADIRAQLGIPDGNTAVMYAPTWREEDQDVELLNVVELSDRLGPTFTFLQRGHVRTLELGAGVRHDNVIDVSTYPQINHLYLASDLLITDYSSMMFDYSVTRRPMIFFTPDIDEYTDPKVRGVYFDLEEIAAGPVVRTAGEVVELLGSIDTWVPKYEERYQAWTERFNHADDGHAAERAVDALFAFDPKKR
jgi:CDP-glycerol glycerophosphotransferase